MIKLLSVGTQINSNRLSGVQSCRSKQNPLVSLDMRTLFAFLITIFSVANFAVAQKKHDKIDLNKEGMHGAMSPAVQQQKKAAPATLAPVYGPSGASSPYVNQEIVIDSVLASIDGVPITLREFSDKLNPKRLVTPSDFIKDPSLGQILDSMIVERLIEAEALSRKIKLIPTDIDRYIEQVAAQNNLSKSDFETALKDQGKSIEDFKKQARLEILRSRLMGQIAQSAPAVTDKELGDSVGEEPESASSAEDQKVRFKLREIVVLKHPGQEELEQNQVRNISQKLRDGENFSQVAKEFSQGATSQNGGDLGELAEDELSEDVRDKVAVLSAGSFTDFIDMSDAFRVFYLDKRFEEGESSGSGATNKERLRKELENRKLELKFQEFFTVELPKLHKVDKKV